MCNLPKGSFFTDIYGLKFCVCFLHWDLQSSGMLHIVYCKLAADFSGQLTGPIFKGQTVQWWYELPFYTV
jgi:hypothetical protein